MMKIIHSKLPKMRINFSFFLLLHWTDDQNYPSRNSMPLQAKFHSIQIKIINPKCKSLAFFRRSQTSFHPIPTILELSMIIRLFNSMNFILFFVLFKMKICSIFVFENESYLFLFSERPILVKINKKMHPFKIHSPPPFFRFRWHLIR